MVQQKVEDVEADEDESPIKSVVPIKNRAKGLAENKVLLAGTIMFANGHSHIRQYIIMLYIMYIL
jgi:hypothetical protein